LFQPCDKYRRTPNKVEGSTRPGRHFSQLIAAIHYVSYRHCLSQKRQRFCVICGLLSPQNLCQYVTNHLSFVENSSRFRVYEFLPVYAASRILEEIKQAQTESHEEMVPCETGLSVKKILLACTSIPIQRCLELADCFPQFRVSPQVCFRHLRRSHVLHWVSTLYYEYL